MGFFSPWHWLVVLLFIALVAAIVVVVIRFATRQPPNTTGVGVGQAAPGWYPSPDDPTLLRWYDGHQWTPQTRPATAE